MHERWTVISSGIAVKSQPLGTQAIPVCEVGVFARGLTDDCRSLSPHLFRSVARIALGQEAESEWRAR